MIAGGGAGEAECALRLTQWSKTLSGVRSYCVRAFAEVGGFGTMHAHIYSCDDVFIMFCTIDPHNHVIYYTISITIVISALSFWGLDVSTLTFECVWLVFMNAIMSIHSYRSD